MMFACIPIELARRGALRVLPITAVALAIALMSLPVQADCTTQTDGSSCVTSETQATISASSATDRAKLQADSVDGTPWLMQTLSEDEADAIGPPLELNPLDNGFSARASTSTWRDHNNKALTKRIEAAKSGAPKDLKLPKTDPRAAPPVELWSTLDVQGGAADGSKRTGVGADYKATKSTTFGLSAERGESYSRTTPAASEDEKYSAYMNYKAAPAVSVDARTQWSTGRTVGGDNGPDGGEKGSVIISPRVGKAFALGEGNTIEPFVNYKREFDLKTTGTATADIDSAGAGVTFAKPDSYSLSVTTDFEGLSPTEQTNVNSKVQFKVPLP